MSETLLNINIYINNKKLIKKTIISDRKILFLLEDNTLIKIKEVESVYIICDDCSLKIVLKNLPENYIIEKKEYFCKSCRNKANKNPMFGKKWSQYKKYLL
jgi:hypothetical protein